MKKIEITEVTNRGVSIQILWYTEKNEHFVNKDLIAEIFEKYGWSFTKALGIALYRADIHNTYKILTTYQEMAKEFIEKFLNIDEIPDEEKIAEGSIADYLREYYYEKGIDEKQMEDRLGNPNLFNQDDLANFIMEVTSKGILRDYLGIR